jgi:excinuclease ABC subunit A
MRRRAPESRARNVFVADSRCRTSWCCRSTKRCVLQPLELPGWRGEIAVKIVKEIADACASWWTWAWITSRSNARPTRLSGGEAQRIRLASQIGAGLVGVMYVLDEPSIGLHQRDNERLLGTLTRLRDLGNTVIVVEHDEDAIRLADHIVDIGPGAGVHGGEVVAQGNIETCSRHPARSPAST